jgi:hypothetical protein
LASGHHTIPHHPEIRKWYLDIPMQCILLSWGGYMTFDNMRIMKKLFLLGFLLFLFGNLNAANLVTLTCEDAKDPNLQFNVTFDSVARSVFWGDKIFPEAVSKDMISYTIFVKNSQYDTIIYRDTGRFNVFVKGESNFSFSGLCKRKISNKF